MYLQMKSNWKSFHRVYFLAEYSVELNKVCTIENKENNYKIRMKYMYKRVFWFILIVKKLEIGWVEIRTGQRSSHFLKLTFPKTLKNIILLTKIPLSLVILSENNILDIKIFSSNWCCGIKKKISSHKLQCWVTIPSLIVHFRIINVHKLTISNDKKEKIIVGKY